MSGDHRKTFRILTPAGREGGTLRIGMRKLQVRLVDESAGGFALACKGQVAAAAGEVLQLRTSGGLHEVRVIRREEFSDGVLLGVERIRDLDDPNQPAVRSNLWDLLVLPYVAGGPGGGGGFRWSWLVGLGLLAVGLLFVGNIMATYRPPPIEARILPGTQKFVDRLRNPQPVIVRGNPTMGNLSRHWQQASQRIASGLGLSNEQQRQIDEIARQNPSANQDAQIRGVLTTQQAEQWRQMQP